MKAEDLRIDVYSGGTGYPSVQSSSVRIIHLPTGTVAECGDYKSQLQNKLAAMDKLRELLGEPDPGDDLIPITIHLRRKDLATFLDIWRSHA